MERGVEHGSHRDAGEHFLHGVDALQAAGVVQRGEVGERLDTIDDLLVDEHALREELSAVSHAVTDGVDFLQVLDDAHLRVDEGF